METKDLPSTSRKIPEKSKHERMSLTPLTIKPIKKKFIGRGKPLQAQAREVIYNVILYCSKEYDFFKMTQYKNYFAPIQRRVSEATGVSGDSLTRILSQVDKEGKITSPKMAYTCQKRQFSFEVDLQIYGRIRDVITELYFQNEIVTVWKILENINSKLTKDQIRRMVLQMGFTLIKTDNMGGHAIMETTRSRLVRIEYLEKIKKCRDEGRTIVYMNEVVVRMGTEDDKRRLNDKIVKSLSNRQRGLAYIVMHTWKPNETVPCDFKVFQLSRVTKQYDAWLRNVLIRYIPDDAAIVAGHMVHPNKYTKGYPNFTATAMEMKSWLNTYSITVPDNYLKAQLYDTILKHKHRLPLDSGENFLTDNGYVLLKAPKYHWGLNPIEIIWPNLCIYAADKDKFEQTLIEEFERIDPDDWKSAMEQTKKIEVIFRENDPAMDEITDILDLHEEDPNTDDENDSADE